MSPEIKVMADECQDARAIMWRAQARMRVALQQEIIRTVANITTDKPDVLVMFVCTSDFVTLYIGEDEEAKHELVDLCKDMRSWYGDCCPVCVIRGVNNQITEEYF